MRVAVVIPVHDEEESIGALLDELPEVDEILVVDDGSRDGTAARLRALRRPKLRVLRHSHRCGKSTAWRTGVRAANADVVVTLDGDGQDDPRHIPDLLAALEGADLANGERVERHDGCVKRLSSRIANGVRRALLRDGCRDTGCGFKAFFREDFLALPWFENMHRYLPALYAMRGKRVVFVPVQHRPRRFGKSKYGVGNRLFAGLADLMGVRWLRRRWREPEVTEDRLESAP